MPPEPKYSKHDLKLPQPPSELAKASVTPMSPSLNPSNIPPELWLLSQIEALKVRIENIEKANDELKASLRELAAELHTIRDKADAAAWRILWAIGGVVLNLVMGGIGALLKH
jgi:hypothetical protein